MLCSTEYIYILLLYFTLLFARRSSAGETDYITIWMAFSRSRKCNYYCRIFYPLTCPINKKISHGFIFGERDGHKPFLTALSQRHSVNNFIKNHIPSYCEWYENVTWHIDVCLLSEEQMGPTILVPVLWYRVLKHNVYCNNSHSYAMWKKALSIYVVPQRCDF